MDCFYITKEDHIIILVTLVTVLTMTLLIVSIISNQINIVQNNILLCNLQIKPCIVIIIGNNNIHSYKVYGRTLFAPLRAIMINFILVKLYTDQKAEEL